MKSFEGDTGPYLQYAHVRLASMARRNPQLHPMPPAEQINTDLLVEPKAKEIIMLLASYPDVVKTALKTREPSGVVTFMFRFVSSIKFHSIWVFMFCFQARTWHQWCMGSPPCQERTRYREGSC